MRSGRIGAGRGAITDPAWSVRTGKRVAVVGSGPGAVRWRDLPIPGRELGGIHPAMGSLSLAIRVHEGEIAASPIDVQGKMVVIIGGGDTGAAGDRRGAFVRHRRRPPPHGRDRPATVLPSPLTPDAAWLR